MSERRAASGRASRFPRAARRRLGSALAVLATLLLASVADAQAPYAAWSEVPADFVPDAPAAAVPNPATTLGTLTTYSERATFEALFPAVLVADLGASLVPPNDVLACPPPFDESTDNGCFALGGIAPGIAVDVVQGSDGVVLTPPFLGVDCVAVGADSFAADPLLRFDPPVPAAGLDLVQPFGGQSLTVEVFGPGGSLGAIPGIAGSPAGTFFGVATSDPAGIARIEFREDAPQGDLLCDVTIPTTVADVTATKVDLPGTPALPGDTITYRIDVANAGPDPATAVQLDDTPDPNTTLAGAVTTTPLALDDGPYAGDPVAPTTVDGTLQPLLLANDFGIPGTPTLAAIPVVGQPTALGGSVDVGADGSFTYTPPPGATGGETDTFTYDVQNGIPPGSPATDTATASILLGLAPVAQDDALSVVQNTSTLLDAAADNGSGADDFGVPAGAVDFYGPVGGPLTTPPGTSFVTASGNTVNFDVSGNGTFTYDATVNAAFSGIDAFEYQITNSVGSDTAVVTLEVQAPPLAVDDFPDMLSAPGDPYHTALNTPLDSTAHATPPVLDNDDRGFPLADVVSYGTSGSPTDQTVPGAPTATDNGGTVVVAADGNFVYTPPSPTFTGPDLFGYRLENAAGFDDGVVTIAVGARPACDDEVDPDDYDALGNVGITVPDPSGVLVGDTGDEISVTGNTAPSSGGTATVAPGGGFAYTSGAGFTGGDTFTYTVGNGFGDSPACTVEVTVANTIWFIDNEAGGGGNGTLAAPYDSLAAYATPALDDAGDIVFIDEGDSTSVDYDTGITLKNNQLLIGQGVDLATASGVTLPPFSDPLPGVASNPILSNSAGDGVTLADANLVTGLDVDNATGAAITGTGTAGSTITQVGIDASGGQGLIFTGATGAIDVNGAVVTNGTSHGIDISGGSASFDFDAGCSVTNPAGAAVRIDGGTSSVVFNGSLSQANNAALVSISNHSTGLVTFQTGALGATNGTGLQFSNANGGYSFNGATTLNGGDAGIDILGSSSGVFTFANTDVTSPSGAAFTIDGLGGTSTAQVDFQVLSSINQASNAAAVFITDHDSVGGPPFVQFIGPVNATNGTGYQFDNADGTYSFNSASSLNGGDAGVDILNGSAGGFTFANLAISSPTNGAFNVDSSSPLISYTGGSITQSSAATAYRANGNSGGAQNIAVPITANTSTATGISLTANLGATINFTGALDVDTTSGNGFVATGGGTVTTNPGVTNTVNATAGGRGVDISNTTIGAAGVTFRSVTTSGAPNGIRLDTTGTSGGLTITGDGTGAKNGSGGTIASSTGDGISLTSTRDVSLTQLNLGSSADHGIDISSVTNFTYQDANMSSDGNADDEHSIRISNLFGVSLIEDVVFDNINEDAVEYVNSAADDATRDVLTIRRGDFNDHEASFGEMGIDVQSSSAALMGLVVDDCDFDINGSGVLGVIGSSIDSSNLAITIQGSTFNAANSFGAGTIQITNASNSTGTNLIDGNEINDTPFNGILVNNDDNATSTATISNNAIDGSGVGVNNGFGINTRQDENGTFTVLIHNNDIGGMDANQVRVLGRDTTDNTGTINATITDNTALSAPNDFTFGLEILIQDDNDGCADIRGNNFIGNDGGVPGFGDDIRVSESGSATLNIEQTSAANISALNNGDSVSVGGTPNFGAGNCPTP